MDSQPVDLSPFTVTVPSAPVSASSRAAGPGSATHGFTHLEQGSNPATNHNPPPFVAHREGRFFIIQQLPASLPGSPPRWRCILATATKGYVSHRDFGPHDTDYLLALRFGQAFEENGE